MTQSSMVGCVDHKHTDYETVSVVLPSMQDLDTTKTIDHLVNLCALLDATSGIVTVQQNNNNQH